GGPPPALPAPAGAGGGRWEGEVHEAPFAAAARQLAQLRTAASAGLLGGASSALPSGSLEQNGAAAWPQFVFDRIERNLDGVIGGQELAKQRWAPLPHLPEPAAGLLRPPRGED
ncbi:unnamed protein product, partial [Prorocentrum cordatum]